MEITFSIEQTPTLIIEHEEGLPYDAQCGGIACSHPSVRGIPVFPYWLQLFESRRLEDLSCQHGCFATPFTEEAADAIEDVWPKLYGGWGIVLDRDRLAESMEGWIPVKCVVTASDSLRKAYNSEFLDWIEGRTGILILDNCD